MSETKSWTGTDVKQKSYETKLWSMDGPTWRIPLDVCWPEQTDIACVNPHSIIRGIKIITKTANDVLASVSFKIDDSGYWITSRDLHKIARKMPHNDAESIFQWVNPSDSPANPVIVGSCPRDPGAQLRDEFFDRMLPRVPIPWIQNKSDLEMIWRIFCGSMLEWMINVQKPVDLIFCQIVPSPYRPGWESAWNWNNRKINREPGALSFGYQRFSYQAKVPYWFIQVIHKKNWWRSTMKAERVRKREYGKRRYLRYSIRTLNRIAEHTNAIFKDWKHQARMSNHHPDLNDVIGWVRHSHPGRIKRIFHDRKNGMPRTVWIRKKKKRFKLQPVAKKAKQLSLLPGIRHFEGNMRHHRAAIVGARKALLGPNGVLLRNVVGDEAQS